MACVNDSDSATVVNWTLRIPVEVIRRAGPAAVVYGAIGHFARLREGECYASYQTIADALGLSRRTVIRHVAALVEADLITSRWTGHHTTKTMTPTPAAALEAKRSPWLLLRTEELREHPERSWAAWCVLLQVRAWARIPDDKRRFEATTGALVRQLNLDLRTVRRALSDLADVLKEEGLPKVADEAQGTGGSRRIERSIAAAKRRQERLSPPADPETPARKPVTTSAQTCHPSIAGLREKESRKADELFDSQKGEGKPKQRFLKGQPDLRGMNFESPLDLRIIAGALGGEECGYETVYRVCQHARMTCKYAAPEKRSGHFLVSWRNGSKHGPPTEDEHEEIKRLANEVMVA